MNSDEMDTHLCLVCQQTIVGLMNYVIHKKAGCQKKLPVPTSQPQPQQQQQHQQPQQQSVGSFKFDTDDGALYGAASYSSSRSGTGGQGQNGGGVFHGASNYSLPNQDSFLSSFQQDSHFSTTGGGYNHPHHAASHSTSDHAYTAVQPGSGQNSSGLDVDVASPLSSFMESAFSPSGDGNSSPIHHHDDLQGAGAGASSQSNNPPDFFQSLELERKGQEKGGVGGGETGVSSAQPAGRTLRSKRKGLLLPEEFDMDLPITMILSNLDFSSDEETGVAGFSAEGFDLDGSDSEWTEPQSHPPPQSHTGGKWKPGQGPSKPSSYNPHRPTGGKWRPGQRPSPKNRFGKSFYCNLCKMTFADKLQYGEHLNSEEHKEMEERTGRKPSKKKSEEVLPTLVPSLVLDSTTGEMVVIPQSSEKDPQEAEQASAIVKCGQNNLAVCQTCNLYFDSVKVYDVHCQTKQHKDTLLAKTQEMLPLLQQGAGHQSSLIENIADKLKKEEDCAGTVQSHTTTEKKNLMPETHTCVICKKTFSRKYEMARHLLTQFHRQRALKHPKALEMLTRYDKYVIRLCPYQCNVCQFYFNRSADLLDHLESRQHTINCQDLVGPLMCVTCKFKTTEPEQILKHLRSQPHRQNVAKNHYVCIIRESHSKITCKYCGVQMHSAVRMKRHIEFRHRDRQMQSVHVLTRNTERVNCPECPKLFRNLYDMRRHFERKHVLKEKPFECKVCNKKFFDLTGLDQHKQSLYHKKREMEQPAIEIPSTTVDSDTEAKSSTPKQEPSPNKAAEGSALVKEEQGQKRKEKAEKKKLKKKLKTAKEEEEPRPPSAIERPRRSIQRPKRYDCDSSSSGEDETDDNSTDSDVNNDEESVSKAIETVLELEKNVEEQNQLPEIHGVDVGPVENIHSDEPLEELVGVIDAELQEENELNIETENESDENTDEMPKPEQDGEETDYALEKKQRRSVVKKMSVFPCHLCDFTGGDMDEVRNHAVEQHPDDIVQCEPCSQVFFKLKHYKVHCAGGVHQKNLNKSNIKLELLVCRFCNKKFTDEKSHELHVEVVHMHNSTEEQIARLCQGRDSVTQLYGDHLKQLEKVGFNARVSCPECGRFFVKSCLIEHLRLHTGERPYKCRHCTKCFSSAITLRRHLQEHIGYPCVTCTECGKTFKKNNLYLRHMKMHQNQKDGIKFDCEKCGATFYDKSVLAHHMKRHSERQFKCEFPGCHWAFVMKAELLEHMCTHSQEKKFLCDICGFEAGTRTRIRRHAKTHEPAKVFPCEFCPYKAHSNSHIKRHMRIHVGSKPFKCLYCSYECNVAENIRKHILHTRKHKGMHMYPCRFCDFKSNCANEFKQHLHQYHADYIRDKASESLVIFTGLYRPEKDVSKPPEGGEIHQVMKGRFVKVYDGTRLGGTGEAVAPAKKKSKQAKPTASAQSAKNPGTTPAAQEPQPSSAQSQQQVVPSSSGQQQIVLSSSGQQKVVLSSSGQQQVVLSSSGQQQVVLTSSSQHQVVPLSSAQPEQQVVSSGSAQLQQIPLTKCEGGMIGVAVSQEVSIQDAGDAASLVSQQQQPLTGTPTVEVVYPPSLPWTVVAPSSRPDAWVANGQSIDMVMPQPCRIQDLQIVGSNQTTGTTTATFINNTSVFPSILTAINVESPAYQQLEPGMYQVIGPGGPDGSITSVSIVNQ